MEGEIPTPNREGDLTPEAEAPEEKFDYEAEKAKIEQRRRDRINKLDALVKAAFPVSGSYGETLKTTKFKENNAELSREENLVLMIEKKDKEIQKEKQEALAELDRKKAELDARDFESEIEKI